MFTIKANDWVEASQILERAGFEPHRHGEASSGMVKELSQGKRWHAYYRDNHIEVHKDITTRKGLHVLVKDETGEKILKITLHDIKNTLRAKQVAKKPPTVIVYPHIKVEYAKNLRELQKTNPNDKTWKNYFLRYWNYLLRLLSSFWNRLWKS